MIAMLYTIPVRTRIASNGFKPDDLISPVRARITIYRPMTKKAGLV